MLSFIFSTVISSSVKAEKLDWEKSQINQNFNSLSPFFEEVIASNYNFTFNNNSSYQNQLLSAISHWQKEAIFYRENNMDIKLAEVELKIAQAYINLGQFRSAISPLKRWISTKKNSPEYIDIKVTAYSRLGNAYQGLGNYDLAIKAYQKSFNLQSNNLINLNNLIIIFKKKLNQTKMELANSRVADRTDYHMQIDRYKSQINKYGEIARKLVNREISTSSVRTLIELSEITPLSSSEIDRGKIILEKLPPSLNLVFSLINWSKIDKNNAYYWLKKSQKIAQIIHNKQAESYTLLELGYRDEKLGNWQQSLENANQAQILAQSEFSYDSMFRAQYLAGIIYQKLGNYDRALTAYRNAIISQDIISKSLISAEKYQRDKFNSEIEPIYRQTLNLLLNQQTIDRDNLKEALLVFDKLTIAQLQNYFGDNCLTIRRQNISQENILKNKNAALINSIILDNSTHIILQLPDGSLHHHKIKVTKSKFNALAIEWNKRLKQRNSRRFQIQSQYFYNILIRPFENKLNDVETLVFVNDGVLRNLPMSALYNQKNNTFLAQKWASVSSLGLEITLTDLFKQKSKVAAFGLEVPIAGWSKLDGVREEIETVQKLIGGKQFLNENFTVNKLKQQLNKNISILHLATHGYFGGTASTSFILSYEGKISALELEAILLASNQSLNLLVLSACETAVGSSNSSDLAILGLAGMAIRSGVISTLGTFWQVQDDEQSALITSFYSYLQNPEYNKATALQQVQINQIQQLSHPQKWAALNLIGDW